MTRRNFVGLGAAAGFALPPLAWAQEKSKLEITDIKLVRTRPKKQYPKYTPSAGSWSTQGVEVANPVSIYPEFKPRRELFAATDVPGFTVEVTTNKGIKGYGNGGPGGGQIVMGHLKKLMNSEPGTEGWK